MLGGSARRTLEPAKAARRIPRRPLFHVHDATPGGDCGTRTLRLKVTNTATQYVHLIGPSFCFLVLSSFSAMLFRRRYNAGSGDPVSTQSQQSSMVTVHQAARWAMSQKSLRTLGQPKCARSSVGQPSEHKTRYSALTSSGQRGSVARPSTFHGDA